MEAVGLVTEYNPFHNGHAYHVAQAKAVTGADTVVAVMSGNYVQRGVPAVFDKWRRTELALAGGVDIVFELPFAFAVQPAHIFARGAVQLLADAGVSSIVFGAEHAELDFLALAQQARERLAADDHFSADYSQTYATAFNDVLAEVVGFRLTDPNDMLGVAYATAVIELGLADQIRLQPIQRIKAGYHDTTLSDDHIASATALRELINQEAPAAEFADYVSQPAAELLAQGAQTADWSETWYDALRYKVLTTPIDELETIYQLTDGLAYRLKETIERDITADYETFMTTFKSKRYTQARLQRTLLYTVLNITDAEMQTAMQQPYLRMLGATPVGRRYLKQQRESFTLPLIHKVEKDDLTGILMLDYRAGRLYQQFSRTRQDKASPLDTGRIPVFIERG